MAVQRNKDECIVHTIEINDLKKDMEGVKIHEDKFNRTIERIEGKVDLLSDTTLNINATLLHFKDFPDRIRKLEDKSTANLIIEKILWLAVGAFVTVFIHQNYIATREKNEYKIEKSK